MRSLHVLTLLCTLCLTAEYGSAQVGLATTYDGQDVYFSSFARMPGGADEPTWSTVFHYNAGSWAAIAHSDVAGNVYGSFLSGDAGIVGWQKTPYIWHCSLACIPPFTTYVSGIDKESIKINTYALAVSSNGRFVATPGYLASFQESGPAVQDLTTGQVWNPPGLSGFSFGSHFQVGNDGTLIGLKADSHGFPVQPAVLVRWRPGSPAQEILTAPAIVGLALSADGHHAIVSTQPSTASIQVALLDLDSGNSETIFSQDSAGCCVTTSVSADGSRGVFFFPDIRAGQARRAYSWNHAAGAPTALSGLPEGPSGAVISGNGDIAWVATASNRVLRFDLNQGSSQEVLSEFPTRLQVSGAYAVFASVPGSVVRFLGSGTIAGEHFRAGRLEFPVVPTGDVDQTAVQVPWELAAQTPPQGYTPIPLVLQKDAYPFELPIQFNVTGKVTPLLEQGTPIPGSYPVVKAAPTDFSHLIDLAHPAIPGETIAVWMTGLGPLDQPLATGAPGPSNPPARPLAHLECGLVSTNGGPAWQGLVLPFVGYAPGLVGVYQVNVTIPSDWPAGISLLDCYTGAQSSSTLSLPVGAR